MINYKEIKEKYPKSWMEIGKFFKMEPEDIRYKNISDLFKFFDSNGFYIDITPEFYHDGINWNFQIWWYKEKLEWEEPYLHKFEKKEYEGGSKIFHELMNNMPDKFMTFSDLNITGTAMYGDNHEYPTRPDADRTAFLMCFHLLENKLNGIKQDFMGDNLFRAV